MMSLEVHGIIRYMARSGVPFKVTDIDTPGIHTPTSYHYKPGTNGNGLAVDLAGPTPSVSSPQLRRIVDWFLPVQHQLAEFLHPWNDRDHLDHVHVAVHRGTILAKETTMPEPPADKKLIAVFPYEGGYIMVAADGAVYAFNCTYRGGLQWDGQNWQLR